MFTVSVIYLYEMYLQCNNLPLEKCNVLDYRVKNFQHEVPVKKGIQKSLKYLSSNKTHFLFTTPL